MNNKKKEVKFVVTFFKMLYILVFYSRIQIMHNNASKLSVQHIIKYKR